MTCFFDTAIYDVMFENDEFWYIWADGNAWLLSDASLADN
jgi:hypothetical protein